MWENPPEVILDAGKANKVFAAQGLDPFFDNGEFIAELPPSTSVKEIIPPQVRDKRKTSLYTVRV